MAILQHKYIMRKIIANNDRFDNLLVIEMLNEFYIEPSGKKRRKAKVQCDCGNIFKTVAMYLPRKGQKCKICRFNTSIVSIGEIYDQLTIIGFDLNKGRKMAICRCVCENVVNMRPELLKSINKTNNCGCQHRGCWKGVGLLSQTFMGRIKRNAAVRNIDFEISIDYLWELYKKQNGKCALTGLKIGFGKCSSDRNEASLDRIDSNKTYVKGNVQWVHKDVNKMKMNLNQNRFIELCKLVSNKF